MKKWIIRLVGLISLIGILGIFLVPEMRGKYLEIKYDLLNENPKVDNEKDVKKILNSFEKISFNKADDYYKKWTKSDVGKYKKILSRSQYRIIHRDDFYKKLVGDFICLLVVVDF